MSDTTVVRRVEWIRRNAWWLRIIPGARLALFYWAVSGVTAGDT